MVHMLFYEENRAEYVGERASRYVVSCLDARTNEQLRILYLTSREAPRRGSPAALRKSARAGQIIRYPIVLPSTGRVRAASV